MNQNHAPMERKTGISLQESIFKLKELVAVPRYGLCKSKDRTEEVQKKLKEIEKELPDVSPEGDWHMLGLYHGLKNMKLCADLYFNSALAKTETRGWHVREDYPKRDDKNWRKWITARQENGKMEISTENIPVEKYKYKP